MYLRYFGIIESMAEGGAGSPEVQKIVEKAAKVVAKKRESY